jgi:carbamoyl-phosphate synthase large subunit
LRTERSKLKNKGELNILFSCIGRRVSLLNSFRKAAKELKISACLIGTDITELSSAMQLCDKTFLVKPIKHPRYISQLLSIVKNNNVKLLIPTVDLDLKLLAKNKPRFTAIGCRVLVSSMQVVDICQDKRKTYRFMLKNGFDTPLTISARTAIRKSKQKAENTRLNWPPNCIVQEFIKGTEFTCDVYVDFSMKVRCVVPRKRIEIRAGEVSKSQIIKNGNIMHQAAEVVTKLGAGPGVITLQLFLTDDGRVKFIEINPRFGGGVPLSIKAGANFPKWILREILGEKINIRFNGFKDKLIMTRYDAEVWIDHSSR